MNFGTIDRVALFGGSQLVAALCRRLAARRLSTRLFSSERHLADAVHPDGTTLRQVAESVEIPWISTDDINAEPSLAPFVTPTTLGLAGGAAWMFAPATAALFGGRLLDFMGIALPQYRGGAHYTWQILRGNRQGSCNLQVIHGGEDTFHRGPIIKRRDYFFPADARSPQDYFDVAVPREIAFLEEFFDEVAHGAEFPLLALQEGFSSYFPFLHTPTHGLIDWRWGTDEIERFICAFDNPYKGASTFLAGRRLHLKHCHAESTDGGFHPFQFGLIYRKTADAVYVATRDGAIVVRDLRDEAGSDQMASVQLGQRFMTPQREIERAQGFDAVYDARGVRSTGEGREGV